MSASLMTSNYQYKKNSYVSNISNDLSKKFYSIENDVHMLKRLKDMQKILLNTGAYSTSNIEKQTMNFDKVKVPQWERDIISNMWDVQTKLSHKLLREIDLLCKEIKKELGE